MSYCILVAEDIRESEHMSESCTGTGVPVCPYEVICCRNGALSRGWKTWTWLVEKTFQGKWIWAKLSRKQGHRILERREWVLQKG